ncbi:signal transducer and activator of transcription 2 isoform X2 [Lissotriton helveticus]
MPPVWRAALPACATMSQWQVLCHLDRAYHEQVLHLYSSEVLPMEVRQYLAAWIESQDWNHAQREASVARVQLQNLLEHLDYQYNRFTQEHNIVERRSILKFKQEIQARYQERPVELAQIIFCVLEEERKIISAAKDAEQSLTEHTSNITMVNQRQQELDHRVMEMKQKVQVIGQEVKSLEEQQEMFDFRFKTFQAQGNTEENATSEPWAVGHQFLRKRRPAPHSLVHTEQISGRRSAVTRPEGMEAELNGVTVHRPELPSVTSNQPIGQKMKIILQDMLNNLDRSRKEILARLQELLGRCETLVHFLEEELVEWMRRQQEACIGAPVDVSLSLLENWFTGTVEAFFQLRHLLKDLADLPEKVSYENDPLRTGAVILQQRVHELLTCLLKRAFVVEDQPCMTFPCKRPLVLRTSVRFSVSTRLLVKLQELNHSLKVTVSIDKNPPSTKGYRKFNVLGTLDKVLAMDDVQKKGLVADFKFLTLKEQRAGAGGKGSKGINDGLVTEELHQIHFSMQFKYQDLELNLETSTLPLVIISNVSQQSSSWASVIWFNLLSTETKNLTFFSNPPVAVWTRLADALSWQFSTTTKRGLNSDQLSMLAEKLCGPHPKPDSQVKWTRFAKENVSGFNFSFWTWFDGVLELVKTHLEDIWNDGWIMGFVSRKKEKLLLKTKMAGTFLLRFSESCKDGAITFSWVEFQTNGDPTVRSVVPYTKRDLSSIPLPEIVRSFQTLVEENIPETSLLYLYPDIPKEKAFGKYYAEYNEECMEEYRRYMKRRLIVVSERQPDIIESPLTGDDEEQKTPPFEAEERTAGETGDPQEQVRRRRPSVRRRLNPLSTSDEEEEEEEEEGPSTSAGQGVSPTRDEEEHDTGTMSRVEAVDIEGGVEEPDTSDHDVGDGHSATHTSPVGQEEVSPGQGNVQPGPAISPSLPLASPMPSGAPAQSPDTCPPPRSRQAVPIRSGPEAPHPFWAPPRAGAVPPVAVPGDLSWMVEGELDMSARILLQVCLEIRSMQAHIVRSLDNLTTHVQSMNTDIVRSMDNLGTKVQSLNTAITSFISQVPSHTTVNVSPCPLPHTVSPHTPRVSRSRVVPGVVPGPASASRVDVSDPEDLDIVVLEDDQKDT